MPLGSWGWGANVYLKVSSMVFYVTHGTYAKETVREVWWPVGLRESDVYAERYCHGAW